MPIKFRCNYCRQFLGISRGRAGEVVDCPTCGRSIRVPGLDGVVLPVAPPELNRQDSKLIRALDELANWQSPAPVAIATGELPQDDEAEIPQPIAEPIPIEVLIAPEPIALRPPPMTTTAEPASTEPSEPLLSVGQALEELRLLADSQPANAERIAAQPEFSRVAPRLSWTMLSACATLLTLTAFAAGYLLASRPSAPESSLTDNNPQPVAPPADDTPAPAIPGRITYHTADGSSLPDRGARVLVLPREREGVAKLSAVGFRAGDDPNDFRLAQAAVQALGGDFAIADDGGQFTLHLTNPGTFQLIVLSRATERGDAVIEPEVLRLLTAYFDQPAQFLGKTKAHFEQVRYRGTGTEIWDHAF